MLEEIKIFLNITDDSKNSLLEIWKIEAKEFIKSIIWDFEEKNKMEIFLSKKWKAFIPGINLKIVKIEKNSWTLLNPSYKEVSEHRFLNWVLYLAFNWEIRVFYSVGYKDIPDDIKMAIKLYIKDKFDFENGKIKKEVVDGDSIEFELDKTTKNTINSLIGKYKSYDFSA